MRSIKLKFTLFMSMILFSVFALCQAVTPPPGVVVPPVPAAPPAWLVSLAQSHPWIMTALVFIGGLRIFLKPLFAGLHTFFEGSGLVAWDQKESAIEQSKPVQVLYFLLDYFGSIKVPVAQVPDASANVKPPASA